MKTALPLDQLGKLLKDTELGLAKIQLAIREVSEEISKLGALQAALEENVEFLKQHNITVSAQEFKKIKGDLIRTKGRISVLRIDISRYDTAEAQAVRDLDQIKKDYAEKLLGPNNILSFRGKKK